MHQSTPTAPGNASGAVALENITNSVATPGRSDLARSERWRVRGLLWKVSDLRRVRSCGRITTRNTREVDVRANGVSVGFSGLAVCGSVWACPVCNSKIQAVRRLEVGVAVTQALAAGGGAAFGAYTLRHHCLSDPDGLWRALSTCWRAVAQDRQVREVRESLGHVGIVRSAEVTHGRNGWHPHLHPIHLFDSPVSASDVTALHTVQMGAWVRAAERLGLEAPTTQAQHLHRVTGSNANEELSQYLAKVSWEMTSTQTKRGTGDSRTPWDLLRSVWESEDIQTAREDLDLWHRYEAFSKGKRALTWSRGLRARVGLDREAEDQEIAEAAPGDDSDAVLTVLDWSPFMRDARLGAGLLAAVGVGGDVGAGVKWCEAHGVPFRLGSASGEFRHGGVEVRRVKGPAQVVA